MSGMKILVTGGLGFIGSNFINHILKQHPEVHVINVDKCDYMARERNVPGHPRYTYIRGDITEHYHMTHIFRMHQPDVVVHFAAQSCVTKSFDLSFQYTKDNVLGTHVLLDTARDYGKLSRFIHISTDEVYGEVETSEISNEKSPLNPSNPYSASKAAAELYVKAYTNGFKLPCIITRGNNVFGPQQYPEKVVPLFISQILDLGKVLFSTEIEKVRKGPIRKGRGGAVFSRTCEAHISGVQGKSSRTWGGGGLGNSIHIFIQ